MDCAYGWTDVERGQGISRAKTQRFLVTVGLIGWVAFAAAHREARLMLPIVQSATAATRPALANTPDTTAALNKIIPNA